MVRRKSINTHTLYRTLRAVVALGLAALLSLTVARVSNADAPTPLPPVTEADGRLGTCYAVTTDADAQVAYEFGARWDRFDMRSPALSTSVRRKI